MLELDNLRLVREWFEAVAAHDLAGIAKRLDEKYLWEIGDARIGGPEATIETWQLLFAGLPDLYVEIEQIFGSYDYVTTQWRMTGTHRGELKFRGLLPPGWRNELMSFLPTNRAIRIRGCTVFRMREGKITRGWGYWDTGNFLRQMGVL